MRRISLRTHQGAQPPSRGHALLAAPRDTSRSQTSRGSRAGDGRARQPHMVLGMAAWHARRPRVGDTRYEERCGSRSSANCVAACWLPHASDAPQPQSWTSTAVHLARCSRKRNNGHPALVIFISHCFSSGTCHSFRTNKFVFCRRHQTVRPV